MTRKTADALANAAFQRKVESAVKSVGHCLYGTICLAIKDANIHEGISAESVKTVGMLWSTAAREVIDLLNE